MAPPTPPLYALDPALPVLLRPDGAVQVGWSPRRAVLVRPPRGLTSAGLATLLRTMHSPISMSELQRQADRQGGVAAGELGGLVAQLVAAGSPPVAAGPGPSGRRRSVCTVAARCQNCWSSRCAVRARGSSRAANLTRR